MMIEKSRLFVIVPTFNEAQLILPFLESWEKVVCIECVLLICNGNPGDETTDMVADYGLNHRHRVVEVLGRSDLFWSGLVALGLSKVEQDAGPGDYVLLTNIDISFDSDPMASMLAQAKVHPRSQIAALALAADGRLLSAGVHVSSWLFSLNKHLYQGMVLEDIGNSELVPVTYLPTRFVLYPACALNDAGYPNTRRLPHYCGDYEYTNRLRLHGYKPFVNNKVVVRNIDANTGFKTFQQRTTLLQRLSKCLDMKCTYNLKYRFWFVWLTYPRFVVIPGLITHFNKILLEIIFGGHRLNR